ncbi:MAG: hypothetical protein IJF40_02735 [Clostridia bacterium]|nr:hypothetical protein [Clostridia bacterium]MBQ7046900.1 hypothetical protein [Oscillospiraceae bacterium]
MYKPKMILIVHNKYLRATRHGANLTFHHFFKKVIDNGTSFCFYDPLAENQPRIEDVPKYFRAYLNGEVTYGHFSEDVDDVTLLGTNIGHEYYQKYTAKAFEKMVAEMKEISEEYSVDVVLWTAHDLIKKKLRITDFQRKNGRIGNVEQYFDVIVAADPGKTIKDCTVRVLKNNFGELSEHYID